MVKRERRQSLSREDLTAPWYTERFYILIGIVLNKHVALVACGSSNFIITATLKEPEATE